MAKKFTALFMALVMAMSLLPMSAFATEGELTNGCQKEEHTHTEACYTAEYTCTIEKDLTCTTVHGHVDSCHVAHTDSCCTTENCDHFSCGKAACAGICSIEHTHGDACYTAHTHGDACPTEQVLICEKIEHTHAPVAQIGSTTYCTLADAVAVANNDTTTEGAVVITLLANSVFDAKMDITRSITIDGNYTVTRDAKYSGTLFSVAADATLTLKDLIIDGNNNWTFLAEEYEADVKSGNRVSNGSVRYTEYEEGAPVASAILISITSNGSVIMEGSTIQNNVGSQLFSVPSGATLTMNAATITHNTKNGTPLVASVSSGGTWIINENTVISNNHTHVGNGILSYMCGTAIMNGGEIYGNTGVDCNGCVMMLYGGSADFTMNDGRIYNNGALYGSSNGWNPAFYVYGNGSHFTMNDGTIEGNFSSSIPGIANNGSNALITLNGGKILNTVSGRGFTAKDVYAYCPVEISETVDSATNGFYNNVINSGTLNGDSWFYSYEMTYSGGGTFNGNVTVQSGAETTMVDGKWLNGIVWVKAIGNDTTLTVKPEATIDGVQVRVLDSVPSGSDLNAEEASAAQAASYVEEEGADVKSPVLYYHRLTTDQKQNITVTYDYNGGLDAQGWSGCQRTTADETFTATPLPTPTREGYTLIGWAYAENNDPECLSMEGTSAYNREAITESLRLIAQWGRPITVTVDPNGGNWTPDDDTWTKNGSTYSTSIISTGDDVSVTNVPTRDGYNFDGWTKTSDNNGNVTLTAKWTAATITVTVNPNGGTWDPDSNHTWTKNSDDTYTTTVPAISADISVSTPSRNGYNFDGWDKTTDSNGNITLTANWNRIPSSSRPPVIDIPESDDSNKIPTAGDIPSVFSLDHYAYVVGYSDGGIHPEANITRAEVATIFFRLLDDQVRELAMTRDNDFSDVAEGQWYNTAISTMAAMEVITGYPDGTFRPNANITRAEFAAIAARFDESGIEGDISFEDVIGHWAEEEISLAATNGWVEGYPDETFRPGKEITRAEAMTMVNRVLHRLPETPDDLLDNMIVWPDNMNEDAWYYLAVQEASNSHDYDIKDSGYEFWTEITEPRDWTELEVR